MKLSDIILSYRMEHNYSMREFAKVCSLSHVQLYFMERGLNSDGKPFVPTVSTLKKLAAGMGISFNQLVSICDDLTDIRLEPAEDQLSPANRTLMAWAASLPPEQAETWCKAFGLTVVS